MLGCYYLSIGAQAFGYTQLIPLIATLGFGMMTLVSKNDIWFVFGLWLYLPQYMVWSFQRYFSYVRSDPVCSLYQAYAFPSMESFYYGVIIGIFLWYTIYFQIEQTWFVWLLLYLFVIAIPLILVYTAYNVWWEILFTALFGMVTCYVYILIIRNFFMPKAHYLQNHFPLYHLGFLNESNPKFVKVAKVLDKWTHLKY